MTSKINIGIYSPSSPATVTALERYERAKAFLENKNFQIVTGSLTGKTDYYRSGSPKERAEELNELLRNPNVDMIMSTIGAPMPIVCYLILIMRLFVKIPNWS